MKHLTNPHFLSIFALLFFSIFALKSLTTPGFYTSHDGETHVARLAQYFIALKDGQTPPRHAKTFYNGLGSPIFVYIYPLPYLIGSFIHILNISFTDSFKILMAGGFVASSIFAYLWLYEFFKSSKSAFLGALFYVWVPYKFSLIYVRGSISELLAYTFVPLAFFSLTKLARHKNSLWVSISAISISLILLSQNLVAVLTVPVMALYVLISSISSKSAKLLISAICAFLWGLAIAAFTYIPSLLEIKFIRFDEIIRVAHSSHFVSFWQLVRSPWGYGFDFPGILNDAMSFQIGLAHILVFSLSIPIIIFLVFWQISQLRKFAQNFLNYPGKKTLFFSLFFLVVFICAVFLMLDIKPTRYIWDKFTVLHIIDIPWRLLGISTISCAFLAAFLTKTIRSGFVFIALVSVVLIANRNHLRINKAVVFDDNHFLNYTQTATQYNEFTPTWRQTSMVPKGIEPNDKVRTDGQNAKVSNVKSSSKGTTFDVEVLSDFTDIRINKFYFPYTKVTVDGNKLEQGKQMRISGGPDFVNNSNKNYEDGSGLVIISLTKGNHHVVTSYEETPLRIFADLLSLVSLLLALGVILKHDKK